MSASIERTGPVLSTRRAAEYCGIAHQTLRNLLAAGRGPKMFKQGRLNVFYPVDLDAWMTTRVIDPAEAVAS
ncbi:helix-turn-helix domain-containing protein [Microbacterium sp. AG238]|uniref:helix-turn-helix domain-containing protein n=1 Tax=Microbacterium sp. AG238 TaxID=2183994 RepID=UPI000FF1E66A|nr:helix-turn-helix domain-containing protein [Microbacterium sp. AG238]RKE60432.1 helix-turn-helix protein [Microbacterium sp. AG238]